MKDRIDTQNYDGHVDIPLDGACNFTIEYGAIFTWDGTAYTNQAANTSITFSKYGRPLVTVLDHKALKVYEALGHYLKDRGLVE